MAHPVLGCAELKDAHEGGLTLGEVPAGLDAEAPV